MTDNIVWTDVVEQAKAHFPGCTFKAFWTKDFGMVDTLYLDVFREGDENHRRLSLGVSHPGGEQGKPQEDRHGRCTCECLFKFQRTDVIPATWMCGDRLMCPNCGTTKEVYVFESAYRTWKQHAEFRDRVDAAIAEAHDRQRDS